jgi:hypothetical protein
LFEDEEDEKDVKKTYQIQKKYIFYPINLGLFIIDQQKGNSFNFKEGINEFITLIAVKFNLPLWEAYSILLKHYDELKVNIPLTKTEAINLFQYHENLEEQYVKVAELPERASEFELVEIYQDTHTFDIQDYI